MGTKRSSIKLKNRKSKQRTMSSRIVRHSKPKRAHAATTSSHIFYNSDSSNNDEDTFKFERFNIPKNTDSDSSLSSDSPIAIIKPLSTRNKYGIIREDKPKKMK